MNEIVYIKLVSALLILLTSFAAGVYPFFKKWKNKPMDSPAGEALASGVFLGAGLIHLLSDSTAGFSSSGFDYPFSMMIAGSTFILFLLLEHIGRAITDHGRTHAKSFAFITFLMLTIHSFIAGSALGFSHDFSMLILILIAIFAHKWAASFALALKISKSGYSFNVGLLLYVIFCFSTPLGVLLGAYMTGFANHNLLLSPIFNAIAAGTFIYLGTLHGLSGSIMVRKCCNLKNFTFVVIGFSIMAVVAIWT